MGILFEIQNESAKPASPSARCCYVGERSLQHGPSIAHPARGQSPPPIGRARPSRDRAAAPPLVVAGGGHVSAARGAPVAAWQRARRHAAPRDMSLLDTLLEAARYIEQQELQLARKYAQTPSLYPEKSDRTRSWERKPTPELDLGTPGASSRPRPT